MPLWTLLSASLGVYLVVRLRLQPLAEARLRADNTLTSVAKAATLAGLKSVRSLAAVCAGVAAAVFLLAAGSQLAGMAVPGMGMSLLGAVSALNGWASLVSARLAVVLFLFSAVAMVWLARQSAENARRLSLDAAVEAELERLTREAQTAGWRDLPSTPAMVEIEQRGAPLSEAIASNSVDGRPLTELERKATLAALEQLERKLRVLDIERRINPQLDDDSKFRRPVMGAIFSVGTYSSLSVVKKRCGQLALITAIASLIGVSAPAIVAETSDAQIRLSDLIVSRDAAAARQAWESERTNPPEPPRALPPARGDDDDDDEQALNEAAVAFERAFAQSIAPRPVTYADEVAEVRRHWARHRVIAVIVRDARSPAVAAYPSMADLADLKPVERAAVLDIAPAPGTNAPRSALGRQFLERLRQRVRGTGDWARFKAARSASFRQALSVHDLGGDFLNDAVGAVLGVAPEPADELGARLAKALRSIPKAAVSKYFELKCAEFERELARGSAPAAIIDAVSNRQGPFRFIDPEAFGQVASARAEIRSAMPVGSLRENPPRLRQVGTATTVDVAVDYGKVVQHADGIAVYEDFFPGRIGGTRATPRTAFLQDFARKPGIEGRLSTAIANFAARTTGAEDRLSRLAVRPKLLDGFSKVGGIVIGEDPSRVSASGITDVRWTAARQGMMQVSVVTTNGVERLGSYATATIRAALGYAADDRRLAVSLIRPGNPERPELSSRVILHPALLDTPVGAALVEVDQFAFDATKGSRDRQSLQASLTVQDHLYRVGVIARLSGNAKDPKPLDEMLAVENNRLTDMGRSAAKRFLQDHSDWTDKVRCILVARPEYYDVGTVAAMRDAARGGAHTIPAMVKRLKEGTVDDADWKSLLGRIAASTTIQFRSGVREEAFAIDDTRAFLRGDGPLWPLTFKILATFDAFPFFLPSTASSDDRITTRAWVFPESGDLQTTAAVRAWVAADPARMASLETVEAFTQLQRLFRAGFDGTLGSGFRIDSLALLAESLPPEPPVATPRWAR